jgi:DnaD/phage-associated family protein
MLGVYNRSFASSEREYFRRWMHEYCYSTVIIGEAYDITVNATGKLSLSYMDSILKGWYESGCKTLEECRARVNMRKQERTNKAKKSSQKSNKTVEAETPKYTDFNSEDALLRALERSYGDEKKGG